MKKLLLMLPLFLFRQRKFPLWIKKWTFVICICSLFITESNAQVGIGILQPDTSAVLHLESEDRGLLLTRLSDTQRSNIVSPKPGLVIYNTTDSTIQYFNGNCWLRAYQRTCDECLFDLTASSTADTIDRIIADFTTFQFIVDQFNGPPQSIGFTVTNSLPLGMTWSVNPNPQISSGTVDATIEVTTFTPAGTYPVIFQVVCGNTSINFVYEVTVLPCYEVTLLNSTGTYDLATDLYNTYPAIPQNQPVCVISNIDQGVTIQADTTLVPAYTTGNLPTGSIVAIVNNGNIIGKGGDGGIAYDPANNLTGEGFIGGNALDLTVDTDIYNNFNIYGGGGGGNAMAFSVSQPLGPITFGIFLGGGGGGGAGDGYGGQEPGFVIGLSQYSPGGNATGGQFGVLGDGGLLNFPINFPISIGIGTVSVDLEPQVTGGDGGAYGFPGTQGIFDVSLGATVTLGPIPIPIGPFPIPIPVPPPPAGDAGFAIKRNGNTCNIPDNNYSTSFLKGRVGN